MWDTVSDIAFTGMITDREKLDELWFTFQAISGVGFGLNDSVRIKAGEHEGEFASVISLEELAPSPTYLIELASGRGDIQLIESDLELK